MQPVVRRVLAIGWLVSGLDIVSKSLAIRFLQDHGPTKLIGNFLTLNFTKNSGAAFSLGSGGSVLLAIFAICAIFVIAYWTPRLTSRGWAWVLGLALGGIVGNLSDRIFRSHNGALKGQVIDWIELPNWPIFNLADSAIVIAALIALLLSFRNVPPISKPHLDGGE